MNDPIKIYDARWETGEFTESEIRRLFEATLVYAGQVGADTVIFARDARLGCARVMETGIEAALAAGFRVYACFDPVSTPLSYFMALKKTLKGYRTMGLTITASHNPGQYIGVKFTAPGAESIGYGCGPLNGLTRVKELYHNSEKYHTGRAGSFHILKHPAEEYIRFSMKQAGVRPGDLRGLKVVLDTFNGSAGPELFRALTKAGAEVMSLRLVPDGQFPTGSPNPTSQHKMDRALELANQHDASLVIGIDGDGDRMVIGDRKGIFSAGFVMIPILESILERSEPGKRHKVLYDPKVNPLALEKWTRLGVYPVLFRNGHSQIKGYMKDTGAIAAAEESGHFYHHFEMGDFKPATENSLFTLLLFLKAVAAHPPLIPQIRGMQDQVYTSGEFNFQFAGNRECEDVQSAVIDFFRKEGAMIKSATDDGIDLEGTVFYMGMEIKDGKMYLGEKWYSAYIRTATNEKGVVRSYISAADTGLGESVKQQVVRLLKEVHNGTEVE